MKEPKKILALIPARSGSKSIPNKNLRDMHGHPLIAYPIGIAQLSHHINRIIVTTDSQEYAAVARSYGAETPFIRPAEFARDESGDIDYYKHALEWLQKNDGYEPDLIAILRPTAPARKIEIIEKAIEKAIAHPAASAVRTAQPTERTPYKMFRIKNEHCAFFGSEDFTSTEEPTNMSRQFLPKSYELNAYVDVIRPAIFRKTGLVYGQNILPLITDIVADIDELHDFAFAEKLMGPELISFLDTKKAESNMVR